MLIHLAATGDSDNSMPPSVALYTQGESVLIELQNPHRIVSVKLKTLTTALTALSGDAGD